MDGEDVFGCKIKVQFVDRASPLSQSNTSNADGSPMLSNGSGSKPTIARRNGRSNSAHTCSASMSSMSKDVAIKLSSSDDNEGVGEDGGVAGAPGDLASRPYDESQVESTACNLPSGGDDVVICGPVEEIDIDMERPIKDINSVTTSLACDAGLAPSKKTKKKKSKSASKPFKLTD